MLKLKNNVDVSYQCIIDSLLYLQGGLQVRIIAVSVYSAITFNYGLIKSNTVKILNMLIETFQLFL